MGVIYGCHHWVPRVKAQLRGDKYDERLQVAVDDSAKDYLRAAETLAAMKRRFLNKEDRDAMKVVQRFQNAADQPYRLLSGAAHSASAERASAARSAADVAAAEAALLDDLQRQRVLLGHRSGDELLRVLAYFTQRP